MFRAYTFKLCILVVKYRECSQKIFDGDGYYSYFYLLCLRMTHTKELSVHTNSESCNIRLGL